MDYQKDNFGSYEMTFRYVEPSNGKTYEMRKYINSKVVKNLGGMYAIYCEEDQQLIFRKSEYLRDRSYGKFVDGKCTDFVNSDSGVDSQHMLYEKLVSAEKFDCKLLQNYIDFQKTAYNLPSYIDKSKLTEEEFQTLRRLIKKSLPSR